MKKLRVVHVGTGAVGLEGLRAIIKDPALELVGQYVHTQSKLGMDSGELAGLGKLGITTTNDWKALLALKPDCLCYMADGVGREAEVVTHLVPFLEQGTNVVTSSLIPLTYPATAPAELREPLIAATKQGNSAFFNSGIDPGFATTQLPVALLSIAGEVESVRIQELSNYGDYAVPHIILEVFGFGKPLDWPRPMFAGGFVAWWTGTVQAVADAMGVDLDEIVAQYDTASHSTDIETTICKIKAGTTAGVRLQLHGMKGGRPLITLEHASWMHVDVAPNWPKPVGAPGKVPDHQYRVIVEGTPGFTCELDCPDIVQGLQWTANHPINAIPTICNSKGLLGVLDLPAFTTRKLKHR